MTRSLLLVGTALALLTGSAQARDLKSVGVSVGTLGNPFFTTIGRGAEAAAKAINPDAKVTVVSADYDLGRQTNQINSFVAAGVDLIILDAVDPKAITPAIERAKAAGVVVVGVDEYAKGEDATVMTDNTEAGRRSCQLIVDRLGGKGDVLIVNGPQVSSVLARVKGCEEAVAKAPGIHVLSKDQDGKGSRDGGLAVGKVLLTRFPHVDAIFAINDPSAIGVSLAMKQLGRTETFITSVDGSPDVEQAIKTPDTRIVGSTSQDPYVMARRGVLLGNDILDGHRPADPVELMPPTLITPENVSGYVGWTAAR